MPFLDSRQMAQMLYLGLHFPCKLAPDPVLCTVLG